MRTTIAYMDSEKCPTDPKEALTTSTQTPTGAIETLISRTEIRAEHV